MKKIKVFFLSLSVVPLYLSFLVFLTVSLLGCNGNARAGDPFSVFSGDFTASLSVEINGNASACLYEKSGAETRITFTSPEVLSGFVFSVKDSSVTLKSGNTEINANERISLLPRLLSEAFSGQKENMTEISTEKTEETSITVIKTQNAVYRFNGDGTPTAIEGVINKTAFKITVNTFSCEKASEG